MCDDERLNNGNGSVPNDSPEADGVNAENINTGNAAGEQQEYSQNRGYSYYDINSQQPVQQPPVNDNGGKEKKPSLLKKFGIVIGFSAVAGVVAGLVFFGVNAVGNVMIAKSAVVSEQAIPQVSGMTKAVDSLSASDKETANTEAVKEVETVKNSSDSGKYETVEEVASECMPSVVTIATVSVQEMQNFFGGSQAFESEGAGTGVIVGQNDTELLIATNNHVVSTAKSLSVGFIDETTAEAQVKGTDAENDLAVISVKLESISQDTLSKIKIATIGSSDDLHLGEQVVAIGNALGYGQSVTSGYVSAKGRQLDLTDGVNYFTSTDLIQIDAAINAGNSGGALLNMKGELVGINEAKSSSSGYSSASIEGMGYAIPIDKAFPILEKLMLMPTREKYSAEESGYLGITCADVTDDIAASYNMPKGVCVTEVIEGGPSAKAGIMKGDVITGIGDVEITTYEKLSEELQYYKAGDTVNIKYKRANAGAYEENTVTVTLAKREIIDSYYDKMSQQYDENIMP